MCSKALAAKENRLSAESNRIELPFEGNTQRAKQKDYVQMLLAYLPRCIFPEVRPDKQSADKLLDGLYLLVTPYNRQA